MATFLAVLKIAGLILLGLLAFVLLVLVLVLFVPVRFSLDAEIPDTLIDKEFLNRVKTESSAQARFHWFLQAVRGSFTYPGDNAFSVKVLFFRVLPGKEDASTGAGSAEFEESVSDVLPEEERAHKQEEKQEEKREETEEASTAHGSIAKEERKKLEEKATRRENAQAAVSEPVEGAGESTGRTESDGPAPTIARFLGKVFDILYLVLTKPYEVLWKIQYTISSVCDKIDDVRGFLDSSLFDRAKTVVWKQAVRLLRGIKPKACDVRVLCGAGDPALTADVLAVFSTLYPVFGGGVRLEPDFEQRIAGCSAHLKGRITLFRVLTCAGIVYFNKDVRKAYKKAKRILRR